MAGPSPLPFPYRQDFFKHTILKRQIIHQLLQVQVHPFQVCHFTTGGLSFRDAHQAMLAGFKNSLDQL